VETPLCEDRNQACVCVCVYVYMCVYNVCVFSADLLFLYSFKHVAVVLEWRSPRQRGTRMNVVGLGPVMHQLVDR